MSESNRGIVQTTEKCFCMVPVHRRAGTRYSVNATGGAHASCQKPCGGACQQILHPGRSRHGRSYQPGDSSAFGLNIRQMDGQNGGLHVRYLSSFDCTPSPAGGDQLRRLPNSPPKSKSRPRARVRVCTLQVVAPNIGENVGSMESMCRPESRLSAV